jgi:hypothetical protein
MIGVAGRRMAGASQRHFWALIGSLALGMLVRRAAPKGGGLTHVKEQRSPLTWPGILRVVPGLFGTPASCGRWTLPSS